MQDDITPVRKLWLRRTLIVDRGFQLGLAFRAGLFAFVVLALLGAGIFVPLIRRLGSETDAHLKYDVATTLLTLHGSFWPVAGACMVFVVLGAIRLSHRVAGPFVRLRRDMEQVGAGKLPAPLHIRKRDFVKREVDEFNRMVHSVAQRFEQLRAVEARASRSLDACEEALSSDRREELEALLLQLRTAQDEVRAQLYVFLPEAGPGATAPSPQSAVAPAGARSAAASSAEPAGTAG